MAIVEYQNSIAGGATGGPISNVAIRVFDYPSGDAATIYDSAFAVTTAPILTDEDGAYSFYAVNGNYDIVYYYGGITKRLVDVLVGAPGPTSSGYMLLSSYGSLAAMLATVGANNQTVGIDADTTLTANITIPANIELLPLNGAIINHAAYTISYAGSTARWPMAQVFNGTGAVTGMKEAWPEWFGAVGDNAANDTLALQAAHDSLVDGGVLRLTGMYKTSGFRITKRLNIQSVGQGKWVSSLGSILPWSASQEYLVKFDSLTSVVAGGLIENVVFNGAGSTFTDAMLVGEGYSVVRFKGCGFHNSVGTAVRLRVWWEGVFDDCMFRGNDSQVNGVVYIDDKYNNDPDMNVNNLTFTKCHWEGNKGSYVKSHINSNLDIIRFIGGSKFEWGMGAFGGIPATGPWVLFDFGYAQRALITHSHFTNFKLSNKYSAIVSIANGCIEVTGNSFSGFANDTYLLYATGGSTANVHDNLSSDNIGLLYTNSNRSVLFEYPISTISSSGLRDSGKYENSRGALTSISAIAMNSNKLQYDATATNFQKSVLVESGASQTVANIPWTSWKDYPGGLRLSVRAKSATGVGSISLQVKQLDLGAKTVPSSYGTSVSWDITSSQLAAIGDNAADRFKLFTSSTNTEAVYIDGVYITPLPYQGQQITSPAFNAQIANTASATITMDNSANVNRRGIYMVYADASGVGGYAMFYSNGSALTAMVTGADFAVGTTDPGTAGKFNVFLTGSSITITNRYGTDRKVAVVPFGFY